MATTLEMLWDSVLKKIHEAQYFDEQDFQVWIQKTTLFKIENDSAYVAYRSSITKAIMERQLALFEATLSEEWGNPVSLILIEQKEMEQMMPEVVVEQRTNTLLENKFNPNYTFENFIEGSSNKEAYAACFASCNQGSHPMFNPLMLFGNSGLGKTHLLHAVGNYLHAERPEAKVIYMYSGDFVSILIEAMKTKNIHGNTVDKVKEQLLDCDYFLIDDIQNLQHNSSQEVFFTVYNKLIEKGSQIIITSDIHPKELSNLQSRLISRFTSGLAINISKPGFETSKAILKKKLDGREDLVTDEVLDYLAMSYSSDVRDLEGKLNRLIFQSTLFNPDVIDLKFATEHLGKEPIVEQKNELTMKTIKRSVSQFYGLSISDLEGKSRLKAIMNARHICVYLSRELLHLPYMTIGKELGKRDHKTIQSSYTRAKDLMQKDQAFEIAVHKIKEKLL